MVGPDAKPEDIGFDQPTVATIETFDRSVYTVKLGKKGGSNNIAQLAYDMLSPDWKNSRCDVGILV